MKNTLLSIVGVIALTPVAFAEETPSPAKSVQKPQLTVEIVVNRYKEGNDEWDSTIGATPAPDVYGKIQLPERECEISVHEDSYIVQQSCPSTEMKTGTPVGIQLYDRDTMRQDNIIAIGTVEYQGDPTEAVIGLAKVRFWYSNPPKPEGGDKAPVKEETTTKNK